MLINLRSCFGRWAICSAMTIAILIALSLGQQLWYSRLTSEMVQLSERLAQEYQASNDIMYSASVLAHSQTTYVIGFKLTSFEAFRVEAETSEGAIELYTEPHEIVNGLCKYESEFTIALSRLSPTRLRVNLSELWKDRIEFEIDGEFPPLDKMCDYTIGTRMFEDAALKVAPVRILSINSDVSRFVVSAKRAAQ